MEVFRYKVVHLGGVHVRSSPHVDSEKGLLLESGTIVQSHKVLQLEGIAFVKLDDEFHNGLSGWVFESYNGIKMLELIEVSRNQIESSEIDNSASLMSSINYMSEKNIRIARNENTYWREVRSNVLRCPFFNDYLQFVKNLKQHSNAATSAWNAQSTKEIQIKSLVKKLTLISKQCIDDMSDCIDLEESLWVLVHMGPRVGYVIDLAIDAATQRYERMVLDHQRSILLVVLEIAGRTKQLSNELSQIIDISEDDLRNFLQRWVIIKVNDYKGDLSNIEVKNAASSKNTTKSLKTLTIKSKESSVLESKSHDTHAVVNSDSEAPTRTSRLPKRTIVNPIVTRPVDQKLSNLTSCTESNDFVTYQLSPVIAAQEDETPKLYESTTLLEIYWKDFLYRLDKYLDDPNLQFASMI